MRWLAVAIALLVAVVGVGALLLDEQPDGPGAGRPAPTTGSTSDAPDQEREPGTTLTACPVQDPVELTVVSLNIHAGRTKAGRLDLATVAEELRDWQADVVLLQEVDRGRERTGGVDQARWLGRELGMAAAYGPTRRMRPGSTGNAVLSRHPIVDRRNHPLPRLPGLFRRGLLQVTIDVDGRRIDAYSTHLDHASPRARRLQARAVAEHVSRARRPVVLGGDLNAEPGMPPLRAMARAGLVDTWLGDDRQGLTVPAYDPRRRIDFVLVDDEFVAARSEVLRSRVSDHRAVRSELQLVPPPCR